jgi:hypothetical protein
MWTTIELVLLKKYKDIKIKEKAIGVVTTYTVSNILFALYPKVLDTELVTFS